MEYQRQKLLFIIKNILKNILVNAFYKELENINSYNFRMIFALSTNVRTSSYIIAQPYFMLCLKGRSNMDT